MVEQKAFPGRVIFDHLPKTAGTAISAWLREELGEGCVTLPLIDWHKELIRLYGGTHSILCGHVKFTPGEGLDPRYQYVTCLREPLDRAISWLYFVANGAGTAVEQGEVDLFLNGPEWERSRVIPQFRNHVTEHFARIFTPGQQSNEDKIKTAFASLQRYETVGLYEDIPAFMRDFADLIGIEAPAALPPKNVTARRPAVEQINSQVRDRLISLNRLDLELYEKVVAWKSSTVRLGALPGGQSSQRRWSKYNGAVVAPVSIPALQILSATLDSDKRIQARGKVAFSLRFLLKRDIRNMDVGVKVHDKYGQLWFQTSKKHLGEPLKTCAPGVYEAAYTIEADLPAGEYDLGFFITETNPSGVPQVISSRHKAVGFEVLKKQDAPGKMPLRSKIRLSLIEREATDLILTQADGRLCAVDDIDSMAAGAKVPLSVEVDNRSPLSWKANRLLPINLSYHWLKPSGEVLVLDGLRTPLPEPGIPAGQKILAKVMVQAPKEPGKYVLMLTLVQENIKWFENMGFEPARLEVAVTHG